MYIRSGRIRLVALILFHSIFFIQAIQPVALAGQIDAPDIASYQMEVILDPTAKTVSGTEQITYRNPSNDILNEVWLRLYLRAFRNQETIWMRESDGRHRGFGSGEDNPGDITVSQLSLGNGQDLLASATITDTLMRVPLPTPLSPGQSLELQVAWTSQLPRVFARTGYGGRDDSFFMVGQWYPKMAVYHQGAWDTEPWHANAEFFHDFGTYDVTISVPEEYVVAATGVPVGEPTWADGQKSVRFSADNVTDFAFAASPDFQTRIAEVDDVEIVLYYLPEHARQVDEYMAVSVESFTAYNDWFGDYPHARLTVVDVPDDAAGAGGMEYPTLITGGTLGAPASSGLLAVVVSHEIAHQWWPMQTATNEAREPWLDEGLTQYSGSRYMVEAERTIGFNNSRINAFTLDRAQYAVAPNTPANLPSWAYNSMEYGAAVYSKPSVGLFTLEQVVGSERFHQALADYLNVYRYQHPTEADFRNALETSLEQELDWFFEDFIAGSGVIDYTAGPINNGAADSTITITRTGAVRVPVEIGVTLLNGAQRTIEWDGQTTSTTFTFPGETVTQVRIDPDHKLIAELDRLDNDISTTPEVAPSITIGGRLTFWVQFIVQLLGLFG